MARVRRKRVVQRPSKRLRFEEGPSDEPITQPPNIEYRDREQQSRVEKLAQLPINPTRFPHDGTMARLNMKQDIISLFKNIGLQHFITCSWPTYERLTLEFLSSLNANDLEHGNMIQFRMHNMEFQLSLDELSDIYQFPKGGLRKHHQDFKANTFWPEITGERALNIKFAKSTAIQNPILRYVHRILSSSLFPRGDSEGAVTVLELFIMWSMFNNVQLDICYYLIRHFLKNISRKGGKIVVGGLITPIAYHLKLDLQDAEPVVGHRFLDHNTISSMNFAASDPSGDFFLFKDPSFRISCNDIDRFTVFNRDNLLLFPPSLGSHQAPPPPQPCGHSEADSTYAPEPLYIDAKPPQQEARDNFASIHVILAAIQVQQQEQFDRIFRQQQQHYDELSARQRRIEQMVRQIYDYHISQGHIVHAPPSSPLG